MYFHFFNGLHATKPFVYNIRKGRVILPPPTFEDEMEVGSMDPVSLDQKYICKFERADEVSWVKATR